MFVQNFETEEEYQAARDRVAGFEWPSKYTLTECGSRATVTDGVASMCIRWENWYPIRRLVIEATWSHDDAVQFDATVQMLRVAANYVLKALPCP